MDQSGNENNQTSYDNTQKQDGAAYNYENSRMNPQFTYNYGNHYSRPRPGHSFKRNLPQSIEDCITLDNTTDNLYAWARRVRLIGIIFYVLSLAGALYLSIKASFYIPSSYSYEKFSFDLFFNAFFTSVVNLTLEFVAILAVSAFLRGFASIHYNTKIQSNLAYYTAVHQEKR